MDAVLTTLFVPQKSLLKFYWLILAPCCHVSNNFWWFIFYQCNCQWLVDGKEVVFQHLMNTNKWSGAKKCIFQQGPWLNFFVRIEFSPLVQIGVNKGHYWPEETTDEGSTLVNAEARAFLKLIINRQRDRIETGPILFMS